MSDRYDEAFLALRRVQLGAALGATQLPQTAVDALVTAFPAEVVAQCTVGSNAGFTWLEVGTRSFETDATERLRGLIVNLLDAAPKQAKLAEAVIGAAGASGFALRLRTGAGAVGLQIEVPFEQGPAEALELLGRCGVSSETLEGLSARLLALLAHRITAFTIDFPDVAGPPRFWLDVAEIFPKAERARFTGVQEALLRSMGVSAPQIGWHRNLAEFCTPREHNHVTVRIGADFGGLIDEAWFRYPDVPVKLVLKLLSQFAAADGNGARIAALSVAAGVNDDAVQTLALGAWTGEPPRVAFEWRSPGLPGVADA